MNSSKAREIQSISVLNLFENDAIIKDGEYELKCYSLPNQIDDNFQQIISNFGEKKTYFSWTLF